MVGGVATVLVKPAVKPGRNVGGGNLESSAKVHHTSPFFPSLCALDGEAEPHITASRIRVLSRPRVAPQHGRPGRPTQGKQRESILRGTALVPPDQSPISRHLSHLSPSHQFADDQTDAEPSPRDLNTLLLLFHFLDPDETPPYNSWKPGRPPTSGLRGETSFVYANGRVQERGLSEQASLPPARRLLFPSGPSECRRHVYLQTGLPSRGRRRRPPQASRPFSSRKRRDSP